MVGSIVWDKVRDPMESITEKDQTENDIKIINLSKGKLSDNEINILNKGLKFTLVPHAAIRTNLKVTFTNLFQN